MTAPLAFADRRPAPSALVARGPHVAVLSTSDLGAHVMATWVCDGAARPAELWEGHRGRVTCLAVAPCSAWVVSGSDDGTVRLWRVGAEADPESAGGPRCVAVGGPRAGRSHRREAAAVSCVAVSMDDAAAAAGRRVVWGDVMGNVRVMRVAETGDGPPHRTWRLGPVFPALSRGFPEQRGSIREVYVDAERVVAIVDAAGNQPAGVVMFDFGVT